MNNIFNRKASYPTILLMEKTSYLRDNHLHPLREAGYNVLHASSLTHSRDLLCKLDCAIIIYDMSSIDPKDTDALRDLAELSPQTMIIAIADDSRDCRKHARNFGATAFLPAKPSVPQLLDAVRDAISVQGFAAPNRKNPVENIFVNQSVAMNGVYKRMRSAAQTSAPTLITGESGTGKELCARTIHNLSAQANNAFITLDCAATNSNQFEAELFGYVRDGSTAKRDGLATLADGGTLFLREICELDLVSQAKLLRFIHNMRVLPVGANTSHAVNVRIIASISTPPSQALSNNTLRSELYYELQSLSIRMPSLHERREDIIPLAEQLVLKYAALEHRSFRSIDTPVKQFLRNQEWPGNVHQLMSFLRAIIILHDGPQITMSMLPTDLRHTGTPKPAAHMFITDRFSEMTLAEVERSAIESAINRHSGSIPRAAEELAIAPSTIYRKMEAWKV